MNGHTQTHTQTGGYFKNLEGTIPLSETCKMEIATNNINTHTYTNDKMRTKDEIN